MKFCLFILVSFPENMYFSHNISLFCISSNLSKIRKIHKIEFFIKHLLTTAEQRTFFDRIWTAGDFVRFGYLYNLLKFCVLSTKNYNIYKIFVRFYLFEITLVDQQQKHQQENIGLTMHNGSLSLAGNYDI